MLLRAQVMVCGGTGCLSSHSDQIKEAFVQNIKELGLDNEIQVGNKIIQRYWIN